MNSRNAMQLNGNFYQFDKSGGSAQPISTCNPVIYMSDLVDRGITTFLDGSNAPGNATAIPCGLGPKYMFNDEFYLFRKEENGDETPITINSNSIAWLSDVTTKFRNTDMSLVPDSYKQFI